MPQNCILLESINSRTSTTQIMNLFIKKIQKDATIYRNVIIPLLYEAQHVSGDTPPIIRSLKLHWQPLVFLHVEGCWTCSWLTLSGAVGAWRQPTTRPTTFHVWKTRGCQCSFRLLMMGGVSPETCWASYKHGIINSDTLLHLVCYFCMN